MAMILQVAKKHGMVASQVVKPRRSGELASPPYPMLLMTSCGYAANLAKKKAIVSLPSNKKLDVRRESRSSKTTLTKASKRTREFAGEERNGSLQSKEQIEAKLLSKYEATMRRERAMSYSFSHQGFMLMLYVQDVLHPNSLKFVFKAATMEENSEKQKLALHGSHKSAMRLELLHDANKIEKAKSEGQSLLGPIENGSAEKEFGPKKRLSFPGPPARPRRHSVPRRIQRSSRVKRSLLIGLWATNQGAERIEASLMAQSSEYTYIQV
ncbi:hypothetical protein Tco_1058008 [Tanacetum coccineum]|uniref:Uncharacterized protein n=1 Tax=Tanacetum coccineum TaxID=301880 RepID=A0ABQ5H7Y3_9ASTR